jgi:hypothetical protein
MLTIVDNPSSTFQRSQIEKGPSFVVFAFVLFFLIWMCGTPYSHFMELAIDLTIKNNASLSC